MATIKDIANKTNISTGAVSRILNNDMSLNVSASTRQMVLAAAAELGYIKREYKKKSDNTKTFGILQWYTPNQELEDPYYLSIRLGVENYCSKKHIKVIRAFKTDSDHMSTLKDIDGLICIGKFSRKEISDFSKLTQNMILVDMYTKRVEYLSISLDFENAVLDVMNYLYEKGYKKIGYLGGKEYLEESDSIKDLYPDKRRKVFCDFCEEHDISYHDYMLEDSFTSEAGHRMMTKLIEDDNMPSAIFAASDSIAIGAISAIKEHGLRIPEDIAIVGFDDISQASFTTPPLTTVHAPSFEMGMYAADIIFSQNNLPDKIGLPFHVSLPCTLVIRESC